MHPGHQVSPPLMSREEPAHPRASPELLAAQPRSDGVGYGDSSSTYKFSFLELVGVYHLQFRCKICSVSVCLAQEVCGGEGWPADDSTIAQTSFTQLTVRKRIMQFLGGRLNLHQLCFYFPLFSNTHSICEIFDQIMSLSKNIHHQWKEWVFYQYYYHRWGRKSRERVFFSIAATLSCTWEHFPFLSGLLGQGFCRKAWWGKHLLFFFNVEMQL